jgi:hypothetical protein
MSDLMPPGPELYAYNRRILAERLGWPGGAVVICQLIDHWCPGWHSSYWHANPWTGRPAGWFAFHDDAAAREEHLYGATPQDLRKAIAAHKCPNRWQWEPGF